MIVVVRLILFILLLSLMMLRLSGFLCWSCGRCLLLGGLSRGGSRISMRMFSCFGLGLLLFVMFVSGFLLLSSFLMVSRFCFGYFVLCVEDFKRDVYFFLVVLHCLNAFKLIKIGIMEWVRMDL